MRRPILLIFLVAAAAGLAFFLTEGHQRPAWTTTSAAALEEFERCLEAQMKLYHADAEKHCRKAVELDPGFVAARLRGMDYLEEKKPSEEDLAWLETVAKGDLSHLNPRERFLVRYQLARRQKRSEDATKELDDFLREHPKDPYALSHKCSAAPTPDQAEACYRKLIKVQPNFVLAQNHLGYLAMGQGRFEEAEERFRTYQYLAPDQANPHDSMGELLLLLGRYGEAETELREALALRPDFEASYTNLQISATLQGNFVKAEEVLKEAEEQPLSEGFLARSRCSLAIDRAMLEGDWEQVWQQEEACCSQGAYYDRLARFRADLWTGRIEDAAALEARAARQPTDRGESLMYGGNIPLGFLSHLRGLRQAASGQLEESVASLEDADRWLPYAGLTRSFVKLQNLLTLTHVLEDLGRDAEAAHVRAAVRSVNPDFLKFESLFGVPTLSPEQVDRLQQQLEATAEGEGEVP